MTSYNQWAWWPVTTFKCSTCSTLRPRRKNLLKKPTKNSKFQKNIQKNQKILQKTFIFLPLDWVPTRLMALFKKSQFQLLVFVTIKMHFKFKRHLCRYLYFFLFENCFNDVSLAREHFHWLSTFQADDWPIRTDFSYCYPRLEKSKATIFSYFTFLRNFKFEKFWKQKYSLWTCGIFLQMSFLKCWNFATTLFSNFAFVSNESRAFTPDFTVWFKPHFGSLMTSS